MHDLNPGLYEDLITEVLARRLKDVLDSSAATADLTNAEAADRLALHVSRVVERAVASLPENEWAAVGTQIARRVVEIVASEPQRAALLYGIPIEPGRVLHAIRSAGPDDRIRDINQPLIPLLDTTLLTSHIAWHIFSRRSPNRFGQEGRRRRRRVSMTTS